MKKRKKFRTSKHPQIGKLSARAREILARTAAGMAEMAKRRGEK